MRRLFRRMHTHEVATLRPGPALAPTTATLLGATSIIAPARVGCRSLNGGLSWSTLLFVTRLTTAAALAALAATSASPAPSTAILAALAALIGSARLRRGVR